MFLEIYVEHFTMESYKDTFVEIALERKVTRYIFFYQQEKLKWELETTFQSLHAYKL